MKSISKKNTFMPTNTFIWDTRVVQYSPRLKNPYVKLSRVRTKKSLGVCFVDGKTARRVFYYSKSRQIENFTSFGVVFTAGLVMFGLALILYIIELQLATKALDTHLQDLADL